MTQVFKEDGTVVPVTKIEAGPCVITQVKIKEKDGVNAVQIGFGRQKKFRLNKAALGHLQDVSWADDQTATVRVLRDCAVEADHTLKRGDLFKATIFTPGEKVTVVGISKGRGFQGVVKRHGFAGQAATHGHKDQLRMSGSIGSTGPQRVLKGTRMAGHMGAQQVTVKNLEIVSATDEEILLKGAVPGARGSLLFITTDVGKIEVALPEEKVQTVQPEVEAVIEEKKEEAPIAAVATTTEEAPATNAEEVTK